ncbi:hypothetical protein PRBEI_2000076600 [Prionailurus iriomotensis]
MQLLNWFSEGLIAEVNVDLRLGEEAVDFHDGDAECDIITWSLHVNAFYAKFSLDRTPKSTQNYFAVERALSENGESENITEVLCFLGDGVLALQTQPLPTPRPWRY